MDVFGVIGGLGPDSTSKFYSELTKRFVNRFGYYPQIIIDSVSFPQKLEEEIIQSSVNAEKMLPFLIRSVKRLNRGGVDFIIMLCNTLHIFIEELENESGVPILNLINETVKIIKNKKYEKIGLLATSKTINAQLFDGFQVICPNKKEQHRVSGTVVRILKDETTKKDADFVKKIIKKLVEQGSEAVVLGCTDLQFLVEQKDFDVEIIDTLEVAIKSSFKRMGGVKNG